MQTRQSLLDRIEQLETLLGADRSNTARLREAFRLEPLHAQMLGMLLAREFVTREGLFTVLYGARPESEWPDDKQLDVLLCKVRDRLRKCGITIKIVTMAGEGWSMPSADKAKLSAMLKVPDPGKSLKDRRFDFLQSA